MDFRTSVLIPASPLKIDYSTNILFIGSCFADIIGSKLKALKFKVEHNPFGVQYNPLSVRNNLEILLQEKFFTEHDLYFFNHQWLSFSHYTAFSDSDQTKSLHKINSAIQSSSQLLKKARLLFITFGTAWVYEFIETGKIVANCHKIPSQKFRHFLLEPDFIIKEFSHLIERLNENIPELKIIFTVSPIRHWKDGAVNNQLSKSILFVAIHKLLERFKNTSYFPAYEIFMDELRDYRFYANDMLHPSDFAIEYIWKKFTETYISKEVQLIIKEMEKILKAMNHRPSNTSSAEYFNFLNDHISIIQRMEEKYPYLNFSQEKEFFKDVH